ncbi:envelope stress response membrane protein PspC [Arsukibacterium sp.]|uniref:envelope stress response membrane protein PspC n=1 Tax=Arsukibacterium sp. TaxID=1977258 RepID=UPI002FDA0DAC
MSKPKRELLRDDRNGKIAGVCAGVADYFGWETWLVRLVTVSAVLLGLGWFVPALYIAGWLVLEKKSNVRPLSAETTTKPEEKPVELKTRIWQRGESAKQALHHLSYQFNSMELRLRDMERHVTSSQFQLNRELNNL